MPLTTAQQVRLRISDQPMIADNIYTFDGSGTIFALPHRVITSATAFVTDSNARWTATGAAFSEYTLSWSATGSANSGYRARYWYSVFNDDEIDHFITAGGNVNGAAIQAVQNLMFDGLKRAAWRASDGSEFDDTKAMGLLKDLYATLKEEQHEDAAAGGSISSWAIEQENV